MKSELESSSPSSWADKSSESTGRRTVAEKRGSVSCASRPTKKCSRTWLAIRYGRSPSEWNPAQGESTFQKARRGDDCRLVLSATHDTQRQRYRARDSRGRAHGGHLCGPP